ncbi:beta-galactosidase [Caerostris extrusa]|uniref:Beta-galactosidase n=1 Tax=Caerostris extrusa TaxID=172846 RepID=A0AAV4NX49_CAEEX|nr:beta-galactosidase [Caerostris extrusa]
MNLPILSIFCLFCVTVVFSRSFTVDYENNTFLKDGKPFRYMSGSIHYFRVPSVFWYDRLYKMKMAGLNAIQTYVEWNHHEPEPGVYNFDGDYNLPKFLKTADDLGLVVILRTGPFIDAERDMGGLPYWLMRNNSNIKLRSYDPTYIKYVDRWYKVLLPIIEPFLYNNGGPIITLQIENEYGSIGCDAQYKSHLRELVKKTLKTKVVLFTTDGSGSSLLSCGKTDEVLSTVDFGTGANVTYNFEMLRWTQASGPLVNSEFYPGWLDHWGQPHAKVSSDSIVKTLTDMLEANASVNVYMFHGGTSFGFTAGSNLGSTFQACPTSYDYDAPLNEAGDPTPKYYAMREAIGKFFSLTYWSGTETCTQNGITSHNYEKVMSLWDFVSMNNVSVFSTYPLSFEDLSHPFGFVLYKATVTFQTSDPAILTVKGIADRAHVYVNKVLQGILSREQKAESIPIRVLKGQNIEILVENQGRICSGYNINDRKGIFQNVTLGSQVLVNWTMTPVLLDSNSVKKIELWKQNIKKTDSVSAPSVYIGKFKITNETTLLDSFLRLDGWHKRRYWPIVGPQVTLYAPSNLFLRVPLMNQITLLELEDSPCGGGGDSCSVQFVDTPVVNGTTPL